MTNNNSPALCNTETGICEIPGTQSSEAIQAQKASVKPLKIMYFTDPICSSCWGVEPQLRKLKLEYGDIVEMNYHMGGLLPDWSYNSGGISKPSDVAHHWDQASVHYRMPIDGDVWLEDPLPSSYPPSIAFKAAQIQDATKALNFLRVLKEMVFLKKKNITRWENIEEAACITSLDIRKLKDDYSVRAEQLFREDLDLARKMGVRGFPSIFISNAAGDTEFIYGARPYALYEAAIQKLYPSAERRQYPNQWNDLFNVFPTMTNREYAELRGIEPRNAEAELMDLMQKKELSVYRSKNGPIWARSYNQPPELTR